ncbi:MAG: glycosyltransferase, partial [Minisyncoccia bacterium]
KNYPQVKMIKNSRNLGFAKAHNQGILTTQSEYILVMNPDIVLEKDFLTKLIKEAEKDRRIGSLGGKLLKIKLGDIEIGEKIKTNIIDSTGLKIFK